jgi:hypothetical protein
MGESKDAPVDKTAKFFFDLSTFVVLPGWFAMLVFPNEEFTEQYIRSAACLIAVMYVFSLVKGGNVEGAGFTTLRGVRNIFQRGSDFVLNGCWLHYLAFDMLIGYSIALDASAKGISQLLVAPFLLAVLMFGPSGYASYQALLYFLSLK